MKKRICMIYTGGTIGMVRSEFGYVPDMDHFRMLLNTIQELNQQDCPDWELIAFDPLLDSSDIGVREWNKMGRVISDHYDDFDGFVILHGTDTMAYSASALSFMLENLGKPVIFTGSQIPLCELRSDARNNIVTSVMLAAEGIVKEVCLYFNGSLLRGNRSTKLSSDQLSAFASPNMAPLAEVGISVRYANDLLQPFPAAGAGASTEAEFCPQTNAVGADLSTSAADFHLQPFSEVPVGVIKVFPGIQFELFDSIMTDKLKGVVLETFGTGNIPSSAHALLPIIKRAYENGTIIVVCSQCLQGAVSLGTYAASKALYDIGAINGRDMTTEAALTKLYYLYSKGYNAKEISQLCSANLRGEICP